MFKKMLKHLGLGVVLSTVAMSASAGVATLNGTISTCLGLCSVLSSVGNDVTATVFIPTADGVYSGSALNGLHTPNIEIEGNTGTLSFIATLYTDAGATTFPTGGAGTTLPTAPGGDTSVTVTGGVASGVIVVAGIGATSGAPIWGIFDLDAGTFTSQLFTTDTDGNPANGETPGHIPLASGTFTTSAVPVPAAAWLMMSALLGLAGVRRARA